MIVVILKKRKNRDPTRYVLRDTLAELGVPVSQMIEAGLVVYGRRVVVPYDRFRGRVVVVATWMEITRNDHLSPASSI
jgi:hypothetical protein